MTGNVKNWKSFNESINKNFDQVLDELTLERNEKYLQYIKKRFEIVGLDFSYESRQWTHLASTLILVNNIPMRFSNSGNTLYFNHENLNFPKNLKEHQKLIEKGYRSAEAIAIALNKALGLNKNARVGKLIKTGLLD